MNKECPVINSEGSNEVLKQNLIKKLKAVGLKITPQRQEILNILLREKHKSAEEIYKEISLKFPNISLDTVYRNLNKLKDLGLLINVHSSDNKQRYELCNKNEHHHHLICLGCGKEEELDFCPLCFIDQKEIENKNFTIKSHQFELFGYCSKCKH